MNEKTTYITGLDLGQAHDYTALAILERTEWFNESGVTFCPLMGKITTTVLGPPRKPSDPPERQYAVRHLERFKLGTSYPDICARVVELFAKPPLRQSTLAVDQTGVGRPIVDMLCRARPKVYLRPITITGGHAVVPDGAGYHVPKKDLVSAMQVLFQSRRLQVARALPDADVFVKELQAFRVKITTSANETFEAWRERDHDDLVLAVAMAVWVGEHGMKQFWIR